MNLVMPPLNDHGASSLRAHEFDTTAAGESESFLSEADALPSLPQNKERKRASSVGTDKSFDSEMKSLRESEYSLRLELEKIERMGSPPPLPDEDEDDYFYYQTPRRQLPMADTSLKIPTGIIRECLSRGHKPRPHGFSKRIARYIFGLTNDPSSNFLIDASSFLALSIAVIMWLSGSILQSPMKDEAF